MAARIPMALVVCIGFQSAAFAKDPVMSPQERERFNRKEQEEAKKAKDVIEKLPNSITLTVGQTKKYSGVQACFFTKPGVIKTVIMHDVLTIHALKAGRVALIPQSGLYASGGPKGKYVNVTVENP
jgi:hypothetical protein